MCGIFGVVTTKGYDLSVPLAANNARGRDAWGVHISNKDHNRYIRELSDYSKSHYSPSMWLDYGVAIGNLRAEPTTEYVREKSTADVQPYTYGNHEPEISIVHNGTIANDKELKLRYGLHPETSIDSAVIPGVLSHSDGFLHGVQQLVGSYAIIATYADRPNVLFFAMNYRPLYRHCPNEYTMVLSSVPLHESDVLLSPYSYGSISINLDGRPEMRIWERALYKGDPGKRALVVCSAGLDSTVAAAALLAQGYKVELLHFSYGARATGPERLAIHAIAERLDVPLHIIDTPIFKDVIKGSRLTETKSEIAQGEAGAEYAHEWVPARNLIMVSIALGCAESWGFDVLALGANLEEAGAYPDNEPEFLNRFSQLIPFAVSDGKRISVATPVGNLMKHEIVKLGKEVHAPFELTWSCYNAETVAAPQGDSPLRMYKHCGKCGPCFMRKTAFEINGLQDPVFT
jgi:7-cyano-7-deazaguanine synthase